MNSREYLTQLKRLHDLMEEEESDLDDLSDLEDEPEGTANGKEAYLKRVQVLDDLYQKHKEVYPKLQERIRRKISGLKVEREQQVLTLRYLDLLEWDDVAYRMDGTKDAVWGVHKRALKHFSELV